MNRVVARLFYWGIRLIVLLLLFMALKAVWNGFQQGKWLPNWLTGDEEIETTHTILLEEMTAMGKLELVKYNFKDVVEQELVKTWLPNPKAVLIVQGEAIGCIDMTKMTIADFAAEDEILVVHMPEPELCVLKIDHNKSKIYNTEYAFTDEGKLVEEAYKQAERQIEKSAFDMGILEQTKENAQKILTPMLEKASGRKVLLKFPMTAKVDKLR